MRTLSTVLCLVLLTLIGCGRQPRHQGQSVAELERLLDSADPTERIQGAFGLSTRGAEARTAIPALTNALKSPDPLLRMQSALAIGAVGPDAHDAVPGLCAALTDPEWSVRRQAALALGQIGPAANSAAAILGRLQRDDPSPLVRKAAQQSIPLVKGR
jgi:HEAT repeat protein